MYYVLYLASLCKRRHWPDPIYESYETISPSQSPTSTTNNKTTTASASTPGNDRSGYTSTVLVNNREYQTDKICATEPLARENAAMRAYLICRNFSVNDGMYPAGHDHGGVVQGVPVAIGTGRKVNTAKSRYHSGNGGSSGGSSGGESHRSGGSSSPEEQFYDGMMASSRGYY